MSTLMSTLEWEHEQYIDRAWQDALSQLAQKNGQILLPGNIIQAIGDQGLQLIAERYRSLIDMPVNVYKIPGIDIYQLIPDGVEASATPSLQEPNGSDDGDPATATASEPARILIPRPSNCWILYRTHRHKQLKAEDPDIPNEEICEFNALLKRLLDLVADSLSAAARIAGSEWRNGTKAFKDIWRVKAKELKLQHAQDHPDYKYNPRKPGQKKRRQRKITTRAVHGAANAPVPDEIPSDFFNYDLSKATVDYLDIEKSADGSSVQYALFPGHHNVSCLKSMADRHNAQAALEPSTTLPFVQITQFEIDSFNRHALRNEMLMGLVGDSNGMIDFNNDVAFAQIRYADQSMPAFQPDPSAEAGLMQPLQQDFGINYGLQYSDGVSAQATTAPSAVKGDLLTEEGIAALTDAAPLDRGVESDFDSFFNFLNDN